MKAVLKEYVIPSIAIAFFIILIGLTIFTVRYKTRQFAGDVMVSDIVRLAQIFEQINRDCAIAGFDYQKNPINFLNVKAFSGSEVGSMNLVYPNKWQGPYLEDNPTMQGKEYQIVRTQAGYFIIPGDGVQLPNGNIIGKDIIIDETSDIKTLAGDPMFLSFHGKPLALPISISRSASALSSLIDFEDEF